MALTGNEQIMDLANEQAELLDPNPDLHTMFQLFDLQFFDSKLGRCIVEWSKKMTSCAGICQYHPSTGLCTIRLSEPLLKLRPRRDFVQTLLHEMIHAYLFVTEKFSIRDGSDGHGPNFQAHMNRINRIANTKITIYHTFSREVAVYKQHWWRCNGVCQKRAPFFGYVKRAMNRPPSRTDIWWSTHQATCNGTFQKIKGPENKSKVKKNGRVIETTKFKGKGYSMIG